MAKETYFTDQEYRLVLSGLGRERKVCEKVEKDFPGDNNLLIMMNSIEKKVKQMQYNRDKEWILCSERLPEEYVEVLVQFKSQGGVAMAVSCLYRKNTNAWSGLCGIKPIAWKPLPEPYKK